MSRLVPVPLGVLARRMFGELEARRAIFDLPERKFFRGDPARDLRVRIHGHEVASPFGPAAGPHTQMAQNLVLGFLAGARVFELKTVQVRDDLVIPRPCIDARTVGFNAEWSQELTLEESLDEYVKGAMLIDALVARGRLDLVPGSEARHADLSLGYDLAGIAGERVDAWIRGALDARERIDRLRAALPPAFRDLEFEPCLSDSVTLSTFHGCPPDEIERIALHLMRRHRLHCVVKWNPTLLGPAETRRLLHGVLGYDEIVVPEGAFDRDTRWEQAVEITGRLNDAARALGLGFGVKFTNTLIVENRTGFLPEAEREVYLSGAPLHVLAIQLVERFRGVFGGTIPVSFSAGIERGNAADAVALGLAPVTICTDLLRAGGYGRLQGYADELGRRMAAAGAPDIPAFISRAYGEGGDVLSNTRRYSERVRSDPRYRRSMNERPPKKLGRALEKLDCVACDKCLPVCPNDANVAIDLDPELTPAHGVARRQYATFADLCNECGNCDVFCPEDGGPYKVKLQFYGDLDRFHAAHPRDGCVLVAADTILGRIDGAVYRVRAVEDGLDVEGSGFHMRIDPRVDPGPAGSTIDLFPCLLLEALRRGIVATGDATWMGCFTTMQGEDA